ncbi:MAG: radical SAM protein [Thermoplasmata archaeon]|nr:MAG: radical SAM protein [Thermoplasmata archaeon]
MLFKKRSKKEAGPLIRHYLPEGELGAHRFHLRSDTGKDGVLIVDSSKLIYLNGTALSYTRFYLEGLSDDEVVKHMRSLYRGATREKMKDDFKAFKRNFIGLINEDEKVTGSIGIQPISNGKMVLSSPYRMDLAITYRCQNKCGHCYNEPERIKKELTTQDWKKILDRLWDAGVPHVVFTGGEPTLRDDLPELIAYAEAKGQITGLITNGRKLADKGYLDGLVQAGLDHVQITVESFNPETHDEIVGFEGARQETVSGLKNAVSADLYLVTNTSVLRRNISGIGDTMNFLAGLGLRNTAFNGLIRAGLGKEADAVTLDELQPVLDEAMNTAREKGISLIWYTPTPYCELNPVNMGLGIRQCTACMINLAVEPNGDVLPCQSYYETLGNMLSDGWEDIWHHELCEKIRSRSYAPDGCSSCALLDVCGGGCPLSWAAGDYMCMDKLSSG